jgi:hypothetical protein
VRTRYLHAYKVLRGSRMNEHAIRESTFDADAEMPQQPGPCSTINRYADVLADMEPGAPGGVVVFTTRGYATDEEADVAFEAFLRGIFEAPDEDD